MGPLSYPEMRGSLGYFYLLSTRTRTGRSGVLCAPPINTHVLPTLPQASCWLWGVEPEASKGSSQRGLSDPLGQLGESRDTIGDGTEVAGALSVCLVPLRSSEDTGGVVH